MATVKEKTIADKLQDLYKLQRIDAKIDEIQILKGELPMEVQDLEDELAGLETRMSKLNDEIASFEDDISKQENKVKECDDRIVKYKQQQKNVRNNREYDALTKEIELQKLEIQLCDKKKREFKESIENKKALVKASKEKIDEKKDELKEKQGELKKIVKTTEKEEKKLEKLRDKATQNIEERLITAYKRIRNTYRNGLAVVPYQRDACGGCFNKVPPQRQYEIRQRKKIILCEHCGRVLVDPEMTTTVKKKLKL